jgi:hypothetical protein
LPLNLKSNAPLNRSTYRPNIAFKVAQAFGFHTASTQSGHGPRSPDLARIHDSCESPCKLLLSKNVALSLPREGRLSENVEMNSSVALSAGADEHHPSSTYASDYLTSQALGKA